MKPILAWHFTAEAGVLRDGRTFEVGKPLPPITGNVEPCKRGYHGSPSVLAALQYAPGPHLYTRDLSGIVKPHGSPVDKYAASEATAVLYAGDVSRLLRVFACQCAADTLYLWEAPEVVKQYLLTQDESLRAAARAAAWAAAWDAQRKRLESWVVAYIESGTIPAVAIPNGE